MMMKNVGRVEICRYLFFRHTGVVDINAASPPQLAYGDSKEGGVFTSAFHPLLASTNDSIDGNRDGVVTWSEFFRVLTERTEQNFQLLKDRNPGLNQNRQTPKAWQLANPVPNSRIRYESLRLGIRVNDTPDRNGVRIEEVYPGSPAEWYGLRVGAVLRGIEEMNMVDSTKAIQSWRVTTTASASQVILNLEDPTLLRLTLYHPDTGKTGKQYIRTLGLPRR